MSDPFGVNAGAIYCHDTVIYVYNAVVSPKGNQGRECIRPLPVQQRNQFGIRYVLWKTASAVQYGVACIHVFSIAMSNWADEFVIDLTNDWLIIDI